MHIEMWKASYSRSLYALQFSTHKLYFSFQDFYNWWRETSEPKRSDVKYGGTEKKQLNKYKVKIK